MREASENARLLLGRFAPRDGAALYSQFAEHLREAIHGGVFAGGERMPSLRTLSRLSGVNYFSAQLATEELMREGLLYKVHGKGMFVRDFAPRSGVVGVYAIGRSPEHEESAFTHIVISYLCHKLSERGFEAMVYYDNRQADACGAIPGYLDAMIKGNRLAALLAVTLRHEDEGWFERLTIPHCWAGQLQAGGDQAQYYAPLRDLLDSGQFQRPLLLFPCDPLLPPERSVAARAMRTAGIELDRCRRQPLYGGRPDDSYAQQACRILREELARPERPDLLFVYPDDAMPGVIAALLERGVSVPDELVLVCHRNREIPLFCPFPAVFLDVSIDQYAESFLEHVWNPLAPDAKQPKRPSCT